MTAAFLAMALAALLQAGEGKMPAKGYARLELPEAGAKCEVPAGWERSGGGESDERERIFGAVLTAPRKQPGPAASLSVEYYAPDNAYFPSAALYLAHQGAAPGAGKPAPAKVRGRKARRWTRATTEVFPPNMVTARAVEVKTETFLLEAATGFYVLSLRAPSAEFPERRKAFQRLLDTFDGRR
ncbi:MAG: hypothetical protein AAB320_09820 [Elusimicrobiota bacterium]